MELPGAYKPLMEIITWQRDCVLYYIWGRNNDGLRVNKWVKRGAGWTSAPVLIQKYSLKN
jgi:hypothetical protein